MSSLREQILNAQEFDAHVLNMLRILQCPLVGHVDGEGKALVPLLLQHVDSLLVALGVDVPCHHLRPHLCVSGKYK